MDLPPGCRFTGGAPSRFSAAAEGAGAAAVRAEATLVEVKVHGDVVVPAMAGLKGGGLRIRFHGRVGRIAVV